MPTIQTQATEMKSARVDRISLVAKAASRIPFKVIKSEEPAMNNPLRKPIDLASVGAIFKKEKPAPEAPSVLAVVTLKGEGFAATVAAIEAAGFAVKKSAEQEDGSVLLEQAEGDLTKDTVVIKMGDAAAVVVKGFSPYNMAMEVDGSSFADLCKAQGFYPGMRTTLDVLSNSVYEVACKSDDPSAAAEAVAKMFDEAKSYAVGLVKALPSKAFKLEAIGPGEGEEDGGEGEGEGAAATGAAAAGATEGAADPAAVKKGEGEGAAADPAKPTEGAADPAAAAAAAPVVKSEPTVDVAALLKEGLAGVTAQLTTKVGELLAPVQKSVDGLNKAVGDLSTKVTEVEGVAKAAQATAEGTVMGSDAGDHANTSVQKSGDGGYVGREIDTAFAPRRRAATR